MSIVCARTRAHARAAARAAGAAEYVVSRFWFVSLSPVYTVHCHTVRDPITCRPDYCARSQRDMLNENRTLRDFRVSTPRNLAVSGLLRPQAEHDHDAECHRF